MAVSQVTLADLAASLFEDTNNANAAIAVKTASAVIRMIEIDNTANAAQDNYVKLYNTAGVVTVGTTVPDDVIEVPANTRYSIVYPEGKTLNLGIAVASVTAGGTTGTTSPGSALIVRIVYT